MDTGYFWDYFFPWFFIRHTNGVGALGILKERYAKREINKDLFEDMKKNIN